MAVARSAGAPAFQPPRPPPSSLSPHELAGDYLSLCEFLTFPPAKMAPTGVNSRGVPVHDCSIIAVTSLEPDSDVRSITTTKTARSWRSSSRSSNGSGRRSWLGFNHSSSDVTEPKPQKQKAGPQQPKPQPSAYKGWNKRASLAGAMNPSNWRDREYMKCVTFAKTKDHLRWTPLHYAAKKGLAQAAAQLLDDGIPIEARTMEEQTALHIAAVEGQLQVVEVLLARKANYRAADKQGRTPVAIATERNNLNMAVAFFRTDGQTKHFAEEKSQLLTSAIFTGDKPTLRLLLASSFCDPNITARGPRPLRVAVEKADAEVVNILLQHGADPSLRSADGSLPLATAVNRGAAEIVRLLIKHGANPHAPSAHGKSSFKIALDRGDKNIMRLLMEREPNHVLLASGDAYAKLTMLAVAVDCNNVDAVRMLLENGADPSAEEIDGTTPLIRAAFPDRLEVLDLLLAHGADTAGPDMNGILPAQSVVFRAARRVQAVRTGNDEYRGAVECEKSSIEVLNMLMQYGADLHKADANGKNLLHLSAEAGLKRISLFCLSNRFNISGADKNGWAALHWAAYGGNVSTAQVLKLRGASASQTDVNGLTPLLIATKYCHTDVAVLLTNESDLNHRDLSGHSALYYACANENMLLAEHLLSNGAMAMEQDYSPTSPPSTPSTATSGSTGVDFFCDTTRASEICKLGATYELRQGHRLPSTSNLKRLLSLGASPNTTIGGTPIACLAAMNPSDGTMQILISAKCDVNIADRNGQTPLHIAASRGRPEIVDVLLAAGADATARDSLGRMPEDVAGRAGHPEISYTILAARKNAAAAAYSANHTPNSSTSTAVRGIAPAPRPQVRFVAANKAAEADELGKLGMQRVPGIQRVASLQPKPRIAGWPAAPARKQSGDLSRSGSRSTTASARSASRSETRASVRSSG